MSVNRIDRYESRVEFDANYFKIYKDACRIIDNGFSINQTITPMQEFRIRVMSERIMRVVSDLGTLIRMANSIYPTCENEKGERRLIQEKAIGLCFDLMTKYQNIFKEFNISEEKYVEEIKNIYHEINCLKKWRESDSKRFKFVG